MKIAPATGYAGGRMESLRLLNIRECKMKYDIKSRIKVTERAEALNILMRDRITFVMDIDIAIEYYNMDLERLLAFDNFDFMHDVCGIQIRIDRERKTIIDDFFLPRCSRTQHEMYCIIMQKGE